MIKLGHKNKYWIWTQFDIGRMHGKKILRIDENDNLVRERERERERRGKRMGMED